MLIDDVGGDGQPLASAATPVGDGDEVAYELDGWSNQLKVTLEGMLDKAGIRRVWEAAVLVIPADAEDEVDALIATLEGAELEELIEEGAQVAFDVHELTADELADLDARLLAGGIVHAWTEGLEVLVAEADAEAVEALIEDLLDPSDEGVGDGDGDGLATLEALSALFVAVDKLVKDPLDAKLVGRFLEASTGIGALGVPYGLALAEWQSLIDSIEHLRQAVAGVDDEELEELDEDHERLIDDGEPLEAIDTDAVNQVGDASGEAATDRRGLARDRAVALRAQLRDLV